MHGSARMSDEEFRDCATLLGREYDALAPTALVDTRRVRQLLHDHLRGIARYVQRLGIASSEAEDVAQEVFVVASSKLHGSASATDVPFLYAIASRLASNARRAYTRRHRAYERYLQLESEPVPTPEDLSDQLRGRVLVESIVRRMTKPLREVFLLSEVEGLTVPEIALRLAVPTGTASSRVRRAREAFFQRVARARSHSGTIGTWAQGPSSVSLREEPPLRA
jgi:RNA polymerase sigma-70 factor (ECF subfamily)